MKQYFDVLHQCPLFHEIGDDSLSALLGCLGARIERFDKKYTVLAVGNSARYIGIVLSGTVQITQIDYFGNRSIVAGIGPSEMFGEAFACAEVESLPVSVIAAETAEVMLIDSRHILYTCKNNCGFHQRMIYNLMRSLALRNLRLHEKLEITSKRSTREKLMTYLTSEAKRAGASSFEIPFDRQELADFLEVDRSGLSVEIGKLRREGILESSKKRFTLL